jgi:hypothetical protein
MKMRFMARSSLVAFLSVRRLSTVNLRYVFLREPRALHLERNEIHAVVKIDVTGTLDHDKLLRFGRTLVSVLAELAGVSLVAADEQQRTGRNSMSLNG